MSRGTQASLEIRGTGRVAVFLGDEQLSPLVERGVAECYLRSIERRFQRQAAVLRPCLCCGAPIRSEGAHHRLCTTCRAG